MHYRRWKRHEWLSSSSSHSALSSWNKKIEEKYKGAKPNDGDSAKDSKQAQRTELGEVNRMGHFFLTY